MPRFGPETFPGDTPSGAPLTPTEVVRVARDERYVRARLWPKVRANLHRVPFLEQILAAWLCATDRDTPLRAKAILLGALAYFVLPADAVPDWLVAIGFADDAAVLAAAVQAIGSNLTPAHHRRAQALLAAERQRPTAPAPARAEPDAGEPVVRRWRRRWPGRRAEPEP